MMMIDDDDNDNDKDDDKDDDENDHVDTDDDDTDDDDGVCFMAHDEVGMCRASLASHEPVLNRPL